VKRAEELILAAARGDFPASHAWVERSNELVVDT
jgi:hypothetical protein